MGIEADVHFVYNRSNGKGVPWAMKRMLCMILCLLLCPIGAFAEQSAEPPMIYDFSGKVVRSYDSETLKYTVEKFKYEGVTCYLSKIWLQDPGQQIRKVTSAWKRNIQLPIKMAKKIPEAALVINGSGYVSPTYPWIPDHYPGDSPDYYYTPLGSLTVTDGAVFRNLEGIPYYGLTLEADGLHMYNGADNEEVLARSPIQTWSFYEDCPMLVDNEDILPEEWTFADRAARRTVIGRVNRNNYLILSVTNDEKAGLSLRAVSRFFRENFRMEWLYDLDGGPSSALICRKKGQKKMKTIMGGTAKDADIMAFTELPEE